MTKSAEKKVESRVNLVRNKIDTHKQSHKQIRSAAKLVGKDIIENEAGQQQATIRYFFIHWTYKAKLF